MLYSSDQNREIDTHLVQLDFLLTLNSCCLLHFREAKVSSKNKIHSLFWCVSHLINQS